MNAPSKQLVLLFVDDEPDIVDIARMCFEMAGWLVYSADNISDAKGVLEQHAVDAVLSDIMMRGGTGIELLQWARARPGDDLAFFLLTGCIDDRITEAKAKGAHGVFNKPCDWSQVVNSLELKLSQMPGRSGASATKTLVASN